MTGIDAQHIGNPRNDGTPGARLYSVPITLSRAVTTHEADALRRHWDRPAVIPECHRPGIMRAAGSRVVLDGTTFEEIKRYHAATLRRVIDLVNAENADRSTDLDAQLLG